MAPYHVDGGRLFYAGGRSCQDQKHNRNSYKERWPIRNCLHYVFSVRLSVHVRWRLLLPGVTTVAQMDDAAVAQVLSIQPLKGSMEAQCTREHLIFPSRICCYCNVIVSGAVAERMKLWAFRYCSSYDGIYLSN